MKRLLLAIMLLCSPVAWAGDLDIGGGYYRSTNGPMVLASGVVSVNDSIFTALASTDEPSDTKGAVSGATFTAQIAAWYDFGLWVHVPSDADGYRYFAAVKLGENPAADECGIIGLSPAAGTALRAFGKRRLYLTPGDQVGFVGFHTAGSALDIKFIFTVDIVQ